MSVHHQPVRKAKDLKDQLLHYLKYWYVFVITLTLSVGGAYLYLLMTVPQYKVSTVLRVDDDDKGDGILKGTALPAEI